MASSIAVSTTDRSIDFSRATASAICKSSSRFALIAASAILLSPVLLWSYVVVVPFAAIGCNAGFHAAARVFDEGIGQYQPGFAHIRKRQADQQLLGAAFRIVDEQPDFAIGIAFKGTAEALAAG